MQREGARQRGRSSHWLLSASALAPAQHTSEWTLDYPPFFGLFELLLSYPARLFDSQMLVISAEAYQSRGAVFYQKLTVILTDLLLFYAISQFVQARGSWYESYTKAQRMLTLVSRHQGASGRATRHQARAS